MGKTAYHIKNMFKSKETREIEARMAFNKSKREFTRYYQELEGSIKNFSKMARDAELSGNHENAKSCAAFVLKLQKTQTKVQGLLQRYEMMYSMQRLTGIMDQFVQGCARMGFNMDSTINLKSMFRNTAEMDKALGKLDAMSDQMNMIFDTIDTGLSGGNELGLNQDESDAEAEALLNDIMGRHNATHFPESSQNLSAVANGDTTEKEVDDTDERLRRMMEDLKD